MYAQFCLRNLLYYTIPMNIATYRVYYNGWSPLCINETQQMKKKRGHGRNNQQRSASISWSRAGSIVSCGGVIIKLFDFVLKIVFTLLFVIVIVIRGSRTNYSKTIAVSSCKRTWTIFVELSIYIYMPLNFKYSELNYEFHYV